MSYFYVPKPPISYTCYVPAQCYVAEERLVPQPPIVYYRPPPQKYKYQPPPEERYYQPPAQKYMYQRPKEERTYQPPIVRVR